ncbi:hypothetical protein ACWOEQ_07720 [Enterococcus asini]|nr:helix-turn-helix domain-containing protein [Enterococcus asini]
MKMSELMICNNTLAKGTISKVGGPRNFAVLLVILESIGVGESFCKLTIDEIASRCGISRDSVMAAVKELTSKPIAVGEQPLLHKRVLPAEGGRRKNLYYPNYAMFKGEEFDLY